MQQSSFLKTKAVPQWNVQVYHSWEILWLSFLSVEELKQEAICSSVWAVMWGISEVKEGGARWFKVFPWLICSGEAPLPSLPHPTPHWDSEIKFLSKRLNINSIPHLEFMDLQIPKFIDRKSCHFPRGDVQPWMGASLFFPKRLRLSKGRYKASLTKVSSNSASGFVFSPSVSTPSHLKWFPASALESFSPQSLCSNFILVGPEEFFHLTSGRGVPA